MITLASVAIQFGILVSLIRNGKHIDKISCRENRVAQSVRQDLCMRISASWTSDHRAINIENGWIARFRQASAKALKLGRVQSAVNRLLANLIDVNVAALSSHLLYGAQTVNVFVSPKCHAHGSGGDGTSTDVKLVQVNPSSDQSSVMFSGAWKLGVTSPLTVHVYSTMLIGVAK